MEKRIITLTLTLLVAAFATASVFTYYPFTLLVKPVSPPIIFEPGSNANQPDLGSDNTIKVDLGGSKASVEITIHPTYRTTYYKNVTLIHNVDGRAYNVWLILADRTNNLPSGSKVWLIIFEKDASRDLQGYPDPEPPSGTVKTINLTAINTDEPQQIGTLDSEDIWEIDFMVYIPEGTTITGVEETFSIHIVYTPSGETPP